MDLTVKAPTFTIPTVPENKKDFKKWTTEIKTYLHYFGQTDKILDGEEIIPQEPKEEDYRNNEGQLPENYQQRILEDTNNWKTRKDEFDSKARFLAITLSQACHKNKKASDLISTVTPGDWKSIWKSWFFTTTQWALRIKSI